MNRINQQYLFFIVLLFSLLIFVSSSADALCEKSNILIVLDRSGSMKNANKWNNAIKSLTSITKNFRDRLRFGLITFSNDANIEVKMGEDYDLIEQKLNNIEPEGETYMVKALNKAKEHIQENIKQDSIKQRPIYIIFITDGSPSDRCPTKEVIELRKLQINSDIHEIKTFVIGFGSHVNPSCLNQMAIYGGTAQYGSIRYRLVSTQKELNKTLSTISKASATTELCNGLDDDCDGKIDNLPKRSTALVRGCFQGKCFGRQICQSGKWTRCLPNTKPTKEICNNKDDNCDGFIDNIEKDKKKPLKRSCQGSCQMGQQSCFAGQWSACSGNGTIEICNNKDDDCDGKIDENLKKSCGKCQIQSCQKGKWGRCIQKKPQKEICNGLDDDCDGFIDTEVGSKGQKRLTMSCKTLCKEGTRTCINGKFGLCAAPSPRTERCNGKDDDCNGIIDDKWKDKIGKECKTKCITGIYQCNPQGTNVYCAGTGENKELCDGIDNDCNGKIDELWSLKGKSCQVGKGTCQGSGVYVCGSDKQDLVCTAKLSKQPTKEICDGMDNNCDGQTDEGIWRDCQTNNGKGFQLCHEGKWLACENKTKNKQNKKELNNLDIKIMYACMCSSEGESTPPSPLFLLIFLIPLFSFRKPKGGYHAKK